MNRWFVTFTFPTGLFTCKLRDDPRDDADLDLLRMASLFSLVCITRGRSETPEPPDVREWLLDYFPIECKEAALSVAIAWRDNIPNAGLPWDGEEVQAAVRVIREIERYDSI